SSPSRAGLRRMPDAVLMFSSTLLVFDHVKHEITIIRNVLCEEGMSREQIQRAYRRAQGDLTRIERLLAGPLPKAAARPSFTPSIRSPVFRSNFTKQDFMEKVQRAKQHIEAGDVFQVVLSQRLETRLRAEPFDVYRALRRVNPAPYLFYLALGENHVL